MLLIGSTVISFKRRSSSSPSTWTMGFVQSVNSSILTLVLAEAKNRFFVAIMLFSKILALRRSMYIWGSLQTATKPKPTGVPFSGYNVSKTTG